MRKIGLFCILALLILVVGYAIVSLTILNPRVVHELETNPKGERARRVMLLSLPSGKQIPVNYLLEELETGVPKAGDKVYAGADFPWWKELRDEGGPVEVLVRGSRRHGHGRAIENDPALRASVFARLRPTTPSWTGTLVEITLDAPE